MNIVPNESDIQYARAELLSVLEGTEVMSVPHEGVVGIIRGQIWRNGKIIDRKPSLETLRTLLREKFREEFGYESAAAYLRAEGEGPF